MPPKGKIEGVLYGVNGEKLGELSHIESIEASECPENWDSGRFNFEGESSYEFSFEPNNKRKMAGKPLRRGILNKDPLYFLRRAL